MHVEEIVTIIDASQIGRPPRRDPAALTRREMEALAAMEAGLRAKEAADRLGISYRTFEVHLHNARIKLGATTTAGAVAKAKGVAMDASEHPVSAMAEALVGLRPEELEDQQRCYRAYADAHVFDALHRRAVAAEKHRRELIETEGQIDE
jgi:DNA-binding CsgD family transcriptional regulator